MIMNYILLIKRDDQAHSLNINFVSTLRLKQKEVRYGLFKQQKN